MTELTVYRGKCSPEQLRDILLMAMTVKGVEEIGQVVRKIYPLAPDYIYFPSNWYFRNSRVNRVELHNYERVKNLVESGVDVFGRTELFNIPRKTKVVMGVSFWELDKISKRSKAGNIFEASQNLQILDEDERGDGPPLKVTFDICIRETVRVTELGLKLHSHWLDFCRACGVKLEQVTE